MEVDCLSSVRPRNVSASTHDPPDCHPEPEEAALLLVVNHRVSAADPKSRLAERDQRLAADTLSEAEKWLGDPPPDRSALAQRNRAVEG
jgi:hypothetical protein